MTPPLDHPPESDAGGGSDEPRSLRVLVADDEPLILRALTRLFERRGHEVHTAATAPEALALLDTVRFDAALVDARMPGSGLEVIRGLEADEHFDGPIMLMSGDLSADPLQQVGPHVKRLKKPFRFPDVIPLVEDGVQH